MTKWKIDTINIAGTTRYQVYRVKDDGTREVVDSFEDEHSAVVCAADLNAWEDK